MATINRFTKNNPARFDPMSLQELMMVPAYKRKQHDAISEGIAQTEAALANVDPLQYHDQLAREQQELYYNKLSDQAQALNSEGFNNKTKSDFLRLNKEYQQAIGPMGTIGKINAAKKVYNQNFKDYMEDATKNKKWSREDALRNWQIFEAQNYSGFDQQGNVANIGQYGAPEKIELMEKLKDVNSILGEQVVREIAAGNFAFGRQDDGSLMIVNRNGRRIETSNAPNIQNAMEMLNAELTDPNSAWSQSIKFEGISPESFNQQLTSGLKAMLTNDVKDNRTESVNFRGVNNTADMMDSNIPSVTEPVVEFNNDRSTLQNLISKIGTPKQETTTGGISPTTGIVTTTTTNSGEEWSSDDFSPQQKENYDSIYNSMVQSGVIPPDSPKYTQETNDIINGYLEETSTFSFSNKILKPNAVDNPIQKPLVFSPKKGTDMERHLRQEIMSGRRKLIDKDTQKEVDIDKLKGAKFDYVGMVSPDNVLQKNEDTTLNNDSFVIPHVVQIQDADGEIKEYYMDRDAQEMKKPEFRASKVIKEVLFNNKLTPGLINAPYSSSDLQATGIESISTQYNPDTDTYNAVFMTKEGNPFELNNATSSQIQSTIYFLFTGKQ